MITHSTHYPTEYGSWAGDPKGIKPDYSRCCALVGNGAKFQRYFQCTKTRGFGPDKAYCKQHDPGVKAARDKKAQQKYYDKINSERPQMYGHQFLAALREIAAGRGDARAYAQEIVANFDAGEYKNKD